jgi:AcrR family transcriptional regulator
MTRTAEPAGHTALLRAARDEFAERGYDGASIRHLAARAGMSLSALYHYYAGKQELLEAILTQVADEFFAGYEAERAAVGEDPAERLTAAVRAGVRYAASAPGLVTLLRSEMRNVSPEFLRSLSARIAAASAIYATPIADGIGQGVFHTPYPDDARRAITAMCNGVGDWYNPRGPLSLDEILSRQVALALVLVEYRPG